METKHDLLGRVRLKLKAAKVHSKKEWSELFAECDKDGSGTLDLRELKYAIRKALKVPPTTVYDYEIETMFQRMDGDGSGTLELAELLEFLDRGIPDPKVAEQRRRTKVARVQRAIQIAFSQVSKNEADLRDLFNKVDLDGGGILSEMEFSLFVRRDLKLSPWDINEKALDTFYRFLDKDGDGLEVEELIDFVQGGGKFGPESPRGGGVGVMGKSASSPTFTRRPKLQTYRNKVQLSCQGSFRLRESHSAPQLPQLACFVGLGRSRPPVSRLASSLGSTCPFDAPPPARSPQRKKKGPMHHGGSLPPVDMLSKLRDCGVTL